LREEIEAQELAAKAEPQLRRLAGELDRGGEI